jgi:hypothetical protein
VTEALIYIKFNLSQRQDVNQLLQEIDNVDGVVWVRLAFGDYDAIAFVQVNTSVDLATVAVKINLIPGVASTSTLVLAAGIS